MMQNNLDTEKSNQEYLYELFKEISNDELKDLIKEINNSPEQHLYDSLKAALERIENERLREQFYWRLYYLIDEEDDLTKLGNYYELLYTHHYLQALKLYISMSEALHEKNKIFTKNEKAKEYLKHFENYVKREVRR